MLSDFSVSLPKFTVVVNHPRPPLPNRGRPMGIATHLPRRLSISPGTTPKLASLASPPLHRPPPARLVAHSTAIRLRRPLSASTTVAMTTTRGVAMPFPGPAPPPLVSADGTRAPLPAMARDMTLNGQPTTAIPRLVYGTAWKKEDTTELVYAAIKAGFRGVDTAAQPRHYREDLVGEGIRQAIAEGIVARTDLYIQTKFTQKDGQDEDDMPYDPSAPLEAQLSASVASSLRNLATPDHPEPYIDCLVLHSPLATGAETVEALRILKEKYVPHQIRHLGISNAKPPLVYYLHELDPDYVKVVQNRLHARTAFEVELRAWCRARGVVFQTFWTLTGNPNLVRAWFVTVVAHGAQVELEVAFYALVLALGGTAVLDGTTNPAHMDDDIEGIVRVGLWAEGPGKQFWENCVRHFKGCIGEEEIDDDDEVAA